MKQTTFNCGHLGATLLWCSGADDVVGTKLCQGCIKAVNENLQDPRFVSSTITGAIAGREAKATRSSEAPYVSPLCPVPFTQHENPAVATVTVTVSKPAGDYTYSEHSTRLLIRESHLEAIQRKHGLSLIKWLETALEIELEALTDGNQG